MGPPEGRMSRGSCALRFLYVKLSFFFLLHGLMNLYAVEAGFNNCAELKQLDSLAERAFLGERTSRMHAAFVTWVNTGSNYKLPSLCFLRSTHCTDTDLATPVYMCSGVR